MDKRFFRVATIWTAALELQQRDHCIDVSVDRAERVVPVKWGLGRAGRLWRERDCGHGFAAGLCGADAPAWTGQLLGTAHALGARGVTGAQHLPAGLCECSGVGQVWGVGGRHPSGLPAVQPACLLCTSHFQVCAAYTCPSCLTIRVA